METHLSNTIARNCESNDKCPSSVTIPCYRQWIVKMWHFGVDSIDEYTGKEFHVTFEEGVFRSIENILKEWKITNKRSEQNTRNPN
jgi:hypothetical protein